MEKVRCPSCKEWADWKENKFRPFCSEKCKSKDLGKWATEQYRIAQEEADAGMEIQPEQTSKKSES